VSPESWRRGCGERLTIRNVLFGMAESRDGLGLLKAGDTTSVSERINDVVEEIELLDAFVCCVL
jgi:hypothetical protein